MKIIGITTTALHSSDTVWRHLVVRELSSAGFELWAVGEREGAIEALGRLDLLRYFDGALRAPDSLDTVVDDLSNAGTLFEGGRRSLAWTLCEGLY
jgi:hypothetical protein